MKINPFKPADMNPYKRQVEKAENLPKTERTDKVEISAEAKEMQQVSPLVQEREARVAELKAQVQSGQYKVDPQDVAKALIKFYRP